MSWEMKKEASNGRDQNVKGIIARPAAIPFSGAPSNAGCAKKMWPMNWMADLH
jgi:hypothetical protein